jgi:hypothetical protein
LLRFFYALYSILLHLGRPSDSIVSEDAGTKARTVATLALAIKRSNHSARSHPQKIMIYADFTGRNAALSTNEIINGYFQF